MARTTSTSPRVGFATAVRSYRPPRDDELSVMRTFARHASHCSKCADPYHVWKTDGELCDRGHSYARDVAKYIYSKGGRPHSVIDKESRNERNEIEVPVDCEVIRNLTRAFHQGLYLGSRKPVVSQDRSYLVSDRQPPRERDQRRVYDSQRGEYGVEIVPGQRRERERYTKEQREARDRNRATIHVDGSKGSLYGRDEAAKRSRKYEREPVVILAEPNGERRYVR